MINRSLELLRPKPCPFELIRIGGSGDGAYLVPDDLDGIDACFSPGVNNYKNFEDTLGNEYGIKCHMCDFSSDLSLFMTPLIEGIQTFKKKWLDIDGGDNSISLAEWIDEQSPDPSKDLMLQIDIEGAEYRNLLAADESTVNRFRIIVIEFHGFRAFRKSELLSKEIEPLLNKLCQTHLCVHAHPNNCCGDIIDPESGLNIPDVIEVTYLRKDRFSGNEAEYIQPQLPHPQDIAWNVRSNPPIHLNEKWLSSGTRSADSANKVLLDNLDYAKWENRQQKIFFSNEIEDLIKTFRSSVGNLTDTIKVHSPTDDLDKVDLALGKKYFLREAYGSYPVEGIVTEDPQFFFHTGIGKNQSITIDLEKSHKLHSLVIGNRTDTCQDRARSLFYIIHEQREFSVNDAFPVMITEEFIEPNGPMAINPLFGKEGRYLTIFSSICTALHFSCIKVF